MQESVNSSRSKLSADVSPAASPDHLLTPDGRENLGESSPWTSGPDAGVDYLHRILG